MSYEIREGKDLSSLRTVAACTSWEAKAAALRLLYGSSLVLPPHVHTFGSV